MARFERHAAGGRRRARVWTPRELAHAAAAPDAPRALCASFCCKEAAFKAAGGGVRLAQVELLAPPGPGVAAAAIDPALRERLGIAGAAARVGPGAVEGELLVVVAFHGDPAPPPGAWPWEVAVESVPLAELQEGGEALLAACFGEPERRELAGRPPATVAGRIAAKRAIARTLAAAGAAPPPLRGLVIGRAAREAPRLLAGAPPGAVPLFSISHTRVAACAAAALPG